MWVDMGGCVRCEWVWVGVVCYVLCAMCCCVQCVVSVACRGLWVHSSRCGVGDLYYVTVQFGSDAICSSMQNVSRSKSNTDTIARRLFALLIVRP